MMGYPIGMYLWWRIFVITVTHFIIIIIIPCFAAMPSLVDFRQAHKRNIVLFRVLGLCACHYVHAMGKGAARAPKIILQDVKTARCKYLLNVGFSQGVAGTGRHAKLAIHHSYLRQGQSRVN